MGCSSTLPPVVVISDDDAMGGMNEEEDKDSPSALSSIPLKKGSYDGQLNNGSLKEKKRMKISHQSPHLWKNKDPTSHYWMRMDTLSKIDTTQHQKSIHQITRRYVLYSFE